MSTAGLRILIVEDDALFAVELQMLVEEIGYEVMGVIDNSAESLEAIYSDQPDLILMDIEINGRLNGIEIGQKIKHLKVPILYITAFDNSAYHRKAQKSNMIGYLVKPLSKYSIQSAIQLAVKSMALGQPQEQEGEGEENFVLDDYFFFKKRQIYQKVAIHEVGLIEADKDYINVYTRDGEKYVARMPITKIEQQLPSTLFFRVHRSYVVNLKMISTIDFPGNSLNILGRKVSISKSRKKELRKVINRMD